MRPLDPQTYQWADNALCFRNAMAINEFIRMQTWQWLRVFDTLNLFKVPLYPVFLAVIHLLNLPFRLAEWLLMAVLPYCLHRAVRLAGLASPFTLLLGGLLFCGLPIRLMEARLLRNILNKKILFFVLLAFTGFAIYFYCGRGNFWPWLCAFALGAGLAVIVREESRYIFIPLLAGFFLLFLGQRSPLCQWLTFLAVAAVLSLVPGQTVSLLNDANCRVNATSLFEAPAFQRLLNLLQVVEPASRARNVSITTATRAKVYRCSPAFARIEAFPEEPAMDHMARNKALLTLNGYLENCREIFVSNFRWALTQAIVIAGGNTGESFPVFCRQSTDEIDQVVAKSELNASGWGIGLLPALTWRDVPRLGKGVFRSVYLLVSIGEDDMPQLVPPVPDKTSAEWFAYFNTWPAAPGAGQNPVRAHLYRLHLALVHLLCPLLVLLLPFLAWRRRRQAGAGLLIIQFIAGAALACYSLLLLDTVGFHHLQWAFGYNKTDIFPLSFLFCITVLCWVYYFAEPRKDQLKHGAI